MKKKYLNRLFAGTLAAAMAISAMPAYAADGDTATEREVVYSFDFEDDDVSAFTNRGGTDTTVISTTDESSVSGSKSLLASGRSSSWHGPAFQLDDKLEPMTEYYISAKVKGKYYTGATFSFQYTNADGETKYQNLANLNGNDWQTLDPVKVSFTEDMTGVFVYFEGGTDDILIDDFVVTKAPSVEIEQDIPSLSDVFANDFKIGNAITPNDLSSKPTMELIKKHFSGSLTAGNEMKPDAVLNQSACQAYFEETGDDTVPQVSFGSAKPFLNYCQENNVPVRIHTLVWHSQTPDWFFKEGYSNDGDWVSKEKMLVRMENYIKAYFEELIALYPDIDFYACDVVNEAWTDEGKPRNPGEQGQSGSNNSAWVQVFGDNSFIEPAFEFARKYAPEGCKLYYNDFNEYMPQKTTAIVEMATALKEKGLIDGIGMQSHLDINFPSVSVYNKALDAFAATGLDIQITELDATAQPDQNTGEKHFEEQAEYYKGIMDSIYAHKDSISAVVIWGVTDDGSWRASRNPLLFDSDYKAKPAFYSIIEGREIPDVTTSEPAEIITTTTTATTGAPDGSTTASAQPSIEPLLGDANEDGVVDIADAAAIIQSLGNKDKYALSEAGAKAADVYNPGDGVTGMDALAIQMLKAKMIDSLPLIEEAK
ncbi:MAG: endo-1,4-beta-xylanase [Ruminococcus flavefaciens]|nr:endo-1,4-beta-xylanase [Ruminococcus flavefaciens]MCM1228721.1 endo-1,4-beta-xylanase [Ruminococcus flavefaciens]